MGLDDTTTDAIAHFGAGIVVSLVDYTSFRIANPKAARVERKKVCLQSIEQVLDAQAQPEEGTLQTRQDSVEYASHVEAIRDYLRTAGLVKLELPFYERIRDFFWSLVHHEKVNKLSKTQKLGVALGFEIFYDSLFGFHYYTQVVKESPIAALSRNLYQIPAFFSGLVAGGILVKGVHYLSVWGAERALDKAIDRALRETKVLDFVVNYEASPEVRAQLEQSGLRIYAARLTRSGQGLVKRLHHLVGKVGEKTKAAAESVAHYQERKERQEQEAAEQRKKRFEELTGDH